MKAIQTVGRRRLVVRPEAGNVKIDILLGTHRIATLDLKQKAAEELELAIGATRDKTTTTPIRASKPHKKK